MQRLAVAGALGALAGVSALPVGAADILRALGSFEAGHSSTEAMERLAAELAETTFERLVVEVEADPDLAPSAVVQAVQNGEAALGWTDLEALTPLVPAYGVMTLPFLFDDRDALFELLEGKAGLGLLLDDELKKHGLTAIGFMDGGGRRIASTTGAIESLGQLESQSILVDGSENQLAALAAMGMAPVAAGGGGSDEADYREVRLQDLAGGSASADGLTLSEAPHATDVIVVLASREQLEGLALDLREMLVATMETTAVWQRGVMNEADAQVRRDFEEQGASFAPLPEAVRAQAKARVRSMVEENAQPDDPLIEAVLANVQ